MSAGYSGTPLATKLGIAPGHRVALLRAPEGFDRTLGTLPAHVTVHRRLTGTYDVIVFFTDRRAALEERLGRLRTAMAPTAGLWVAWPKRASKVPTDMTEDEVRRIALPTGLVDNKVCAVDDTWSGLRLVIRRELR